MLERQRDMSESTQESQSDRNTPALSPVVRENIFIKTFNQIRVLSNGVIFLPASELCEHSVREESTCLCAQSIILKSCK